MSAVPDAEPAVLVDGVAKRFFMPRERVHTLKERALHPLRKRGGSTTLDALRDVSFDVEPGRVLRDRRPQRLGQEHAAEVPGRDLRAPTAARSRCDGRLSTFIELGVGFNPDLAARDNVVINAIMLGLTPARGARAASTT